MKTLGLEGREVERLRERAEELRRERLDRRTAAGRLRARSRRPPEPRAPSRCSGSGAWRVSTGDITTGELVQAMALFAILGFPFRIVGFLLEELPRAVVAHDRITGVLAAPRSAPSRRILARCRRVRSTVELEDVRFAYEDDGRCSTSVSAHVDAGEVVALVGSTGSGKSTLCSLLVHLHGPRRREPSGWAACRSTEVDPDELHQAAALVFQESFLFADTVRENLAMGAAVDRRRAVGRARDRPGPSVRRAAAPGARRGHRRARRHALRRSAPAHRAGPRAAAPAAPAPARRRHVGGRRHRGAGDPRSPARRRGRHHHRRRAPRLHHRARRSRAAPRRAAASRRPAPIRSCSRCPPTPRSCAPTKPTPA